MRMDGSAVGTKVAELEKMIGDASVEAVWVIATLEDGDTVYYSLERASKRREFFVLLTEDRGVVDVYPLDRLSAAEIFDAVVQAIEEAAEREVVDVKLEACERVY
jgi:rRNA maturation protein Rpf1